LLKAFRSWARYDQTRPVRHWLLRIAANEAISIGRERTRDRDRSTSADDATAMPDRTPLPDESAVAREERDHVRRAVARLPELYRVPIVLRYFSELSLDEIAAVTGRPASTLGVQLLRARAMLRTALEVTR
jgi:RNA polymerase sigma-70 factor (ECF subfamily)